jgi:hypothetical protein
MPSDVSTFGISLAVSAITIGFTARQSRTVASAVQRHYEGGESEPTQSAKPIYQSPGIVRAYTAQALDVATNYPAAILTIVAYSQLSTVSPAIFWIFLLAAITVTLISVWLIDPKLAGAYSHTFSRGPISLYSGLLVMANIAGLGLAVLAD